MMLSNFSKSKIFLISCLFFIVGVAIASFLPDKFIRHDIWWFAVIAGSVVALVLFWNYKVETRHGASLRLLLFILPFLFLGIWRYSLSLPENRADRIWFYNGSEVNVRGIIIKEPDVRRNFTKYTVETSRGVSLRGAPQSAGRRSNLGESANATGLLRSFQSLAMTENKISGKILVTANLYPAYHYGDELEIKCKIEAPKSFNDFAYDKYLARYDIYSVCYYPGIKLLNKVETRRGASLRSFIFSKIFFLKNKLSEKISQGMSEPEAALARGIVLGERADIDQKINDNFSRTGLAHLIAISGMNISILVVMVMSAFIWLGLWRRQAFYATILFLIVYLVLIGLPASALRAGIMGGLVLYALTIGRLNKISNSLIFAGALMIFANPKLLRNDVGFQLSFLAILGIIYIYPALDKWFLKIGWTKFKPARDVLNITLAAQIFTLPLIAVNFSLISIIAPLANLLVLWTMPVVMVVVLAGLPLSFIFPSISFLFFLPAQLLLKFVILVAEIGVEIPYAYLKFNFKYADWLAGLYYAIVIFILVRLKKTKKSDIAV